MQMYKTANIIKKEMAQKVDIRGAQFEAFFALKQIN